MSIPEAVRLVMQAGAMARGGEVFLLDMGDPIRIYDLALQMIRLSGLTPGEDVEVHFTGLRPGEKLYEELLIDGNNIQPTQHPKVFCANEYKLEWDALKPTVDGLLLAAQSHNLPLLRQIVGSLVPEYQPSAPVSAAAASPTASDRPTAPKRIRIVSATESEPTYHSDGDLANAVD
jgi:FlaA1/EpsC-like NDP-sugar epimerase